MNNDNNSTANNISNNTVNPTPNNISNNTVNPVPNNISNNVVNPTPNNISNNTVNPTPSNISNNVVNPTPNNISNNAVNPVPNNISNNTVNPMPNNILNNAVNNQFQSKTPMGENLYNNGYQINNVDSSSKKVSTKSIILMIISILNMIFIFPVAFKFSVIYLLLSGLAPNAAINFFIITICSLYIIFSIIFLLKSTYKVVKDNKVLKIIFFVAIILIVLLNVISYNKTGEKLNNQRKNETISEMIEATMMEPSGTLFTDSNLMKVSIEKVYRLDDYIYVKFNLNNISLDKYCTLAVKGIKVNGIDVEFENDSNSNFANVDLRVQPSPSSNSYGIFIRNSALDKKSIKIDKSITIYFKFSVYSSISNTGQYENILNFDNYIPVFVGF